MFPGIIPLRWMWMCLASFHCIVCWIRPYLRVVDNVWHSGCWKPIRMCPQYYYGSSKVENYDVNNPDFLRNPSGTQMISAGRQMLAPK